VSTEGDRRSPREAPVGVHDTTLGAVIFQVYIFRQLLVAFTFAVGGMMFIALPGIAVAAVHKLAGVETAAIVRFIPLLMLGLVPYILPLGYLLATVVTYGRLAADNEWTAIRMAGVHPIWICIPPMILALLCSVGTVWLISTRLPEDKRNQTAYLIDAATNTITSLSPGRTELHLGRFYLQAAYREGNDFRRAFIHIPGKDGRGAHKLQADSLSIDVDKEAQVLVVRMRDARVVHGSVDVESENPIVRIDLRELIKPRKRGHSGLRYKTSGEIDELLEYEEDPSHVARMRFEIHHRNAMATTFLMFCLLGIPTGLLLRRGTQLAALSVAVGYALVYYVLSLRLSESLAETQLVPPELAAWSVNILGACAGLFMTWKALRQ
jgi:lipopolysaccharide export system permease protein